MRSLFYFIALAALTGGCTTVSHDTVIPAHIVRGKVTSFGITGLCGSVPFVAVCSAMVRISDPESLRGQNLTVWTSEDFPFRKGDLVEFDFSKVGIDRRQDGSLSTGMMPSKMEPNQSPEPTPTTVTPPARQEARQP